MKLSIDIIFDKLDQHNIRIYSDKSTEPGLDCPRLLSKGMVTEGTNYLYVGYAQDIDIHKVLPGSSLVSIGVPDDFSYEVAPNFNLMIITESISLDEIFNRIMDVFVYFNQWENKLHELLHNGSELQDFVNASDVVIGWPISILDRAEKTLASSSFEDSDDIIWKEICSGYIRTELLVKDSVKITEVMKYDKPIQRYSTVSGRVILSQAIRVNGHVVGFIAAHHPHQCEQLFSRGVEQLVNYLTSFVAERMRCIEFYNMSRGSMFEYLLVDLIEGIITDEELIEDRLLFLNWHPNKKNVMLRIEAPLKKLITLRDHIHHVVPNSRCIIYNKCIVAIISDLVSNDLQVSLYDLLQSFLKEYHAKCGISNPFSSLSETSKYFNQASFALRIGKAYHPESELYPYSQFTVYHALSTLSKHVNISDFYHQIFRQFLPLTKANGVLFDTLRVYLQTNCNIAASAKKLYIHRNSMIYRIKRLEEEFHIDFSDVDTRLQLLMSYKIYDIIELTKTNESKKQRSFRLNGNMA